MARPSCLALDAPQQAWRTAPMPGANLPLELVRLDSAGETFAILGRFPAGFARPVSGGYAVAEEFLVLDGALELEGRSAGPGTLCFVPAHHPRAPMRSPDGCTVLAWFAGPPVFRPREELRRAPSAAVAMVDVEQAAVETGLLLRTSESEWRIAEARQVRDAPSPVDVVDLARTRWARVGAGRCAPPAGPVLARLPLTDGRP